MSARLNPYLTFEGTTREAMTFYQEVFGGDLILNTFSEYGVSDPATADKIMHAMLETDQGFTLMAADTPPGTRPTVGDAITVSVSGDEDDLLRGYWEALSDGGTVAMPLEKQLWGDQFGQCVDRFGTPWMVNIAQPLS
jgi:PhnB protein